jgi:hypothetical protein
MAAAPVPISTLIDQPDAFEQVRDQIAFILATDSAGQQTLANAAGENPDDWELLVYTERSAPWETYLNKAPNLMSAPIVNVWYEGGSFDGTKGNVVSRQHHEATYNVDVYGFASVSLDPSDPSMHRAADSEAAFAAQRGARLCRNILMASQNTYLQLPRPGVWRRWITGIQAFQPQLSDDNALRPFAMRLSMQVGFNEFSPQYEGSILDEVRVIVYRDPDGKVLAEADFIGLESP